MLGCICEAVGTLGQGSCFSVRAAPASSERKLERGGESVSWMPRGRLKKRLEGNVWQAQTGSRAVGGGEKRLAELTVTYRGGGGVGGGPHSGASLEAGEAVGGMYQWTLGDCCRAHQVLPGLQQDIQNARKAVQAPQGTRRWLRGPHQRTFGARHSPCTPVGQNFVGHLLQVNKTG